MSRATPPGASPREHGRDPDSTTFDLLLYVAGQHPNSTRAIENLHRICEEHLPGRHQIEIIDLLEHPEMAREEEIFAVPTLVRRIPEPVRTIIGDLSDTARALAALGLSAPELSAAPSIPDSVPGPRSASPIATGPTPGGMIHHRVDAPAHLGHPTRRGSVILIAGVLAAAFWGIVLGNVIRGTNLHRSLVDLFAVTNRFALVGAVAGVVLFLLPTRIVILGNHPALRRRPPEAGNSRTEASE